MMALPMRAAAAMQTVRAQARHQHAGMRIGALSLNFAMTDTPMRVVAAMPTAPRLVVGRRVAMVNNV